MNRSIRRENDSKLLERRCILTSLYLSLIEFDQMGRWIALIFLNKYIIRFFELKFVFLIFVDWNALKLKNHWNGENVASHVRGVWRGNDWNELGKGTNHRRTSHVRRYLSVAKDEELLRDCMKSNPCKRRSYVAGVLMRRE